MNFISRSCARFLAFLSPHALAVCLLLGFASAQVETPNGDGTYSNAANGNYTGKVNDGAEGTATYWVIKQDNGTILLRIKKDDPSLSQEEKDSLIAAVADKTNRTVNVVNSGQPPVAGVNSVL